MSWMLPDADQRLARGLKTQSALINDALAACAIDKVPDDIAAPLADMQKLIENLQQQLHDFQE